MTQSEHIRYYDLATLKRWGRNYRQGDVGAIIQSIARFGFNGALRVWRDDVVIAGNHALMALLQMKASAYQTPRGIVEHGNKWLIPCIDVSHLNEIEAEAYAIADNRTQERGDNDSEQLAALLSSIAAEDAELLRATGYDGDDVDALLAELGRDVLGADDPGAQIDRSEELQAKWKVQRGDVWQIGQHRLMCGDSTSADDVARLMAGEQAVLLASDPPYNLGFNYDDEVDDEKNPETYAEFTRAWFDCWCAVSARQIVTPGCANLTLWLRLFEPYHVAPWIKTNSMTRGKASRFWCWEPVLFFGQFERRRHSDVFDYPIGWHKKTGDHPCPKPLKMWVDLLENYTERGAAVCDAFDGSGTTLVACELTGRRGFGMEIAEKYVAVALERLAGMGLEAVRVETQVNAS